MRRMNDKARSTNCIRPLALSLLLVMQAAAGELNFTATVDQTTVGLGEQIQLTVTVEGSNIGRVPRPQLPALPDFDNLGSTQAQSTNISLIGGRLTQQQAISFSYVLVPKRLGDLTIGPCRITYNNTEYTTQPITIHVVRGPQRPQPPSKRPGYSPFDIFNEPEPSRGSVKDAVQLMGSPDRTVVYQGEQVTVTYTFYTAAQVTALNIKAVPPFTGFWVDNLYEAKQLNYENRTRNGRRFSAATIRQVALFPTQSGELKVAPMTVTGQLVQPGFFFDQTVPFEVSSEPFRITVKPLPESGRPADFCGGVGSFRVTARLDKDSSVGGEPLTFTIRVSGTGNIGLIGAPPPPQIEGVKVLNPETKDNITSASGRVRGERDFNYPLIPQADGKFLIPAISLSFFDPGTGRYYTQTTEPLTFVAQGTTGALPATVGGQGMRVLGSDIVHIHQTLTRSPRVLVTGRWWTWLCYPAGLLLLAGGAVLGRHRRRLEQDRGYARRARSSRLVRKRLQAAERQLAANQLNDFYAALSQAVLGFVGDRFNLEVAGMTTEVLRQELEKRGVDAPTVASLLDLTRACDAARFSPGMTQCAPAELLTQVRNLLEKL